jgi:hypothetical protein
MRILALLLLTLIPGVAWAQTTDQRGLWFDVHPGLGLGGHPFEPSLGVRTSAGWWWGNYDRGFILGRSVGIGVAFRADVLGDVPRLAPSLEIRRTVDLLVVGYRWRVLAGPEWAAGELGVGARLGGTLKYRPSRWVGPTLDLEAGAAWVAGRVSPRFGVAIGVEITGPVSRRKREVPADPAER